jgi:hypothetical protein
MEVQALIEDLDPSRQSLSTETVACGQLHGGPIFAAIMAQFFTATDITSNQGILNPQS